MYKSGVLKIRLGKEMFENLILKCLWIFIFFYLDCIVGFGILLNFVVKIVCGFRVIGLLLLVGNFILFWRLIIWI